MIPDDVGDDRISLFPLMDVHWRHRGCNEQKFLNAVDAILNRRATFWWSGGDLTENSGRYSIGGGVYEQIAPPQVQQDEMIEILRPIAHKCFLHTRGNHGYRSYKEVGLDPDLNIANAFDIPYFVGQYHMDINWRGNTWSVVGYHGAGKGSSPRSRIESLIKTARLNEIADIHCMGHVHHRMNVEFVTPRRNRKTGTLEDVKSRGIIFGGFLEYWNQYADENAFEKTHIGTYSVDLYEDGKVKIVEEDLED